MAKRPLTKRWEDYQASTTVLLWSCASSVALTLIVGFTVAGWVTGGTAAKMASTAAEQARSQLVATICVETFSQAADANEQLAKLKATSSWERDDFVSKGGWTTPVGFKQPVPGAADLCADKLAEMTLPAKDGAVEKKATFQ